jgi:CubicO group peptidase (beta-lactamase class C family)
MAAGLGAASAEPGVAWSFVDPGAAAQATPVARAVEDYAGRYHPTALMVVHDDVVVATSGDIARKVNLPSVRKSLLSALFGIAVERGQVDLDSQNCIRSLATTTWPEKYFLASSARR